MVTIIRTIKINNYITSKKTEVAVFLVLAKGIAIVTISNGSNSNRKNSRGRNSSSSNKIGSKQFPKKDQFFFFFRRIEIDENKTPEESV